MSLENITPQMRWDCEKNGCYHKKKQPKFGVFANYLPPRMAFTDIDGALEIGGNLLFLEWKTHGNMPTAQRIMYERISIFCPAVVLLVEGDAETMTVFSVRAIRKGHVSAPLICNLETLCRIVQAWARWAVVNPVTIVPNFVVPILIPDTANGETGTEKRTRKGTD